VEGGAITADKHLLEAMKDPLMHLIRNAIDHGIEPPQERLRQGKPRVATLRLRAHQTVTNVVIEIADDGQGLDEEAIRRAALHKRLRVANEIAALTPAQVQMLIFAPGFSTSTLITDVSGRGVGLDVVRTNIERLKGTVSVESVPGRGCTFRLQAPITLATTRVLLVQVAQWTYALPVESVQETSLISLQSVFSLEGRPTISRDGQPVSVAHLADLLELPSGRSASLAGKKGQEDGAPERNPCILLAIDQERLGLFVDAVIDEQEVVLKPFGGLLQRVRNVSAATVLSTGEICMVLNPQDLIKSAKKGGTVMAEVEPSEAAERSKVILLAEDSITTRTQEKRILESAGYEVVTAVDGADAFNKLGSRLFDAVVSDIEMPNMNGLTLAARIRQDAKYKELPIILVTSLASDADRQRGSEVGANAYITKGTFEQKVLLDTLRRLV
jgi:two-component system chemotaxis sensor kinase CheA